MKHSYVIPACLSHLKVDPRGFPIPFFVAIIDGKPDFRRLDERKQHICILEHKCPICGRKLNKDYNYVITGPIGYQNRTVTDPPMHKDCAEFTLRTCPHLVHEKTDRIHQDQANNPLSIMEKPSEIRLIRISKWKPFAHMGHQYVSFTPVSYQSYHYENGILTAD